MDPQPRGGTGPAISGKPQLHRGNFVHEPSGQLTSDIAARSAASGVIAWAGGRRHVAPPERVAHGGAGHPPRRHGRLRPVATPGRPDPVRPPVEPTTQSPGREEADEGGAGGFYNASVEAVRRRDGTGLPPFATSPAGQPLKSMSSARRRMTIHSRCGSRRKPLPARTDERCLISERGRTWRCHPSGLSAPPRDE